MEFLHIKEWMTKIFIDFDREYKFLYSHPEKFPIKNSFILKKGVYVNVMCGELSDGTVGSKTILVDDNTGVMNANLSYFPNGGDLFFMSGDCYLTVIRSALMAAYVVYKAGGDFHRIGFIGGGKINLATAFFLYILGYNDFILVGGRKNRFKNIKSFNRVTENNCLAALELLKTSDVIIACTNSNNKYGRYRLFDKAKLHIVQDGGFTLEEEWRLKYCLYSDYPEQLLKHYEEEFPFDTRGASIYFDPIENFNKKEFYTDTIVCGGSGVYLYGTIIGDLVMVREFVNNETLVKNIIDVINFQTLDS